MKWSSLWRVEWSANPAAALVEQALGQDIWIGDGIPTESWRRRETTDSGIYGLWRRDGISQAVQTPKSPHKTLQMSTIWTPGSMVQGCQLWKLCSKRPQPQGRYVSGHEMCSLSRTSQGHGSPMPQIPWTPSPVQPSRALMIKQLQSLQANLGKSGIAQHSMMNDEAWKTMDCYWYLNRFAFGTKATALAQYTLSIIDGHNFSL